MHVLFLISVLRWSILQHWLVAIFDFLLLQVLGIFQKPFCSICRQNFFAVVVVVLSGRLLIDSFLSHIFDFIKFEKLMMIYRSHSAHVLHRRQLLALNRQVTSGTHLLRLRRRELHPTTVFIPVVHGAAGPVAQNFRVVLLKALEFIYGTSGATPIFGLLESTWWNQPLFI